MYWLFQANPRYSRILRAIQELDRIYWLVTRYNRKIAVGDEILIWICGQQAGIYGLGTVLSVPEFVDQPPDLDYWILPMLAIGRFYAPVQFTHKLLDCPLLKTVLVQDPILRDLQVLRSPHNTNFKVTPQQWQRVQEWLQLES